MAGKKRGNSYTPRKTLRTTEERLRFAINFSQANLSNMSEGDLLNLRDDLWAFAERHTLRSYISEERWILRPWPREMSLGELRSLQSEMLKALWAVAPDDRGMRVVKEIQVSIGFKSVRRTDWRTQRSYPGVSVFGSTRDVVLYELFGLLRDESEADRIRSCPGCRLLFYKVKRQKCCSRRCTNRVYMRRYRAKHGDLLSETNHKAYEKRTKKRIGTSVKVARRRRSK